MKEHSKRGNDEKRRRPLSMHEGVETWEDTCVCEPEPRWQKLQEEASEDSPASSGEED